MGLEFYSYIRIGYIYIQVLLGIFLILLPTHFSRVVRLTKKHPRFFFFRRHTKTTLCARRRHRHHTLVITNNENMPFRRPGMAATRGEDDNVDTIAPHPPSSLPVNRKRASSNQDDQMMTMNNGGDDNNARTHHNNSNNNFETYRTNFRNSSNNWRLLRLRKGSNILNRIFVIPTAPYLI